MWANSSRWRLSDSSARFRSVISRQTQRKRSIRPSSVRSILTVEMTSIVPTFFGRQSKLRIGVDRRIQKTSQSGFARSQRLVGQQLSHRHANQFHFVIAGDRGQGLVALDDFQTVRIDRQVHVGRVFIQIMVLCLWNARLRGSDFPIQCVLL